jgi:cell division protein FtsB
VIALALGVATVGVETDREALALLGLGATGLLAAALAATASRSIRRRDELRAANKELQRRSAELEAQQLAIESGLDVIDVRTQGRLRELVEESGDELAELIDEALDESDEGTP